MCAYIREYSSPNFSKQIRVFCLLGPNEFHQQKDKNLHVIPIHNSLNLSNWDAWFLYLRLHQTSHMLNTQFVIGMS
jgi:hypothetical protein